MISYMCFLLLVFVGATVAGGRGFYLKDEGVLINIALYNFGLAFLRRRKYNLLHTSFFMTKVVLAKCAQLAQFDEELYKVKISLEYALMINLLRFLLVAQKVHLL